jgi:hypothetical protein
MQSYINYLLADIAGAGREPVAESRHHTPGGPQQSIDEYFREMQQFLENYPQHPFSYYCGLSKEQFPPATQLSEEQMNAICAAFRSMLDTWNITADIHIKVPASKIYSLLVSVLDEKVSIGLDGVTTIEFCNYHPPSCAMGEYCTCREFYEKEYPMDHPDHEEH